jgi:DNA-binding CsgD family transcriptional regulator/tetratricopeptide (TPR) repeat protein
MSPRLIGREAEMAVLGRALDDAAGTSAVVLLAGEAGVGKSRLVTELGDQASRRGFQVCIGHCVELGEQIWPLAPLREIVAGLVADLDATSLGEVLGSARTVLGALVPDVEDRPADGPPAAGEPIGELAVGLFRRLARRAPLLLVIEDLHWADHTTRDLFSLLAGVGRVQPSLLVGTFRDDDVHRRHPLRSLLAEIERHAACARIQTGPLDLAATTELISAITSGRGDRASAAQIYRRSGGSPFYIEELVAAADQGVDELPATLRDTILARAATLDSTAQHVLDVIAAAGSTTSGVLLDVCGLGLDDLHRVLDQLYERALLVVEGEEVRFRHELAREVFDHELLPGSRARIHAALAASLQRRRPGRLGAIARHWFAAQDPSRALAAYVVAGRQALGVGAAGEAEGHFERALELWDVVTDASGTTGADHVALLQETAVAAQHARHVERAIAVDLAAVDELAGTDALREAHVWLHLRDLYRYCDRFDACAAAIGHALELIPADPQSAVLVQALSYASAASLDAGCFAEATEQARQAVAAAEVVGNPEALVHAHYALWLTVYDSGERQRALDIAQANLARCSPDTPTDVTLVALTSVHHSLVSLGRRADAIAVARRAVELARSTGLGGPRASWMACFWLEGLGELGRWDEAERVTIEVADLTDDLAVDRLLAVVRGTTLIRQGRLAEARPLIEAARRRLQQLSWADDLAFTLVPIVMLDAAEGRTDAVINVIDQQLQRSPGFVEAPQRLVAAGIAVLADHVLATAGGEAHTERTSKARVAAARWLDLLEHFERTRPPMDTEGRIRTHQAWAHYSRLCGRHDLARWTATVAGWVELGYRYEEAEARFHLAEATLSGVEGRSAAARVAAHVELTRAHSIASDLPAPPLRDRIEGLARRARISLGPTNDGTEMATEPVQDFDLTRREFEVLALLASGRTNGEIATELFISPKTASVHVSNILRKLGVTNRVEAAGIAIRRQVPPVRLPGPQH